MSRRTLLLACLVGTTCSLPNPESGGTAALRADALSVHVVRGSQGPALLFQAPGASGSNVSVARLEGARIVLVDTEGPSEHLLPFSRFQADVDALTLECAPFREQTIRIRVSLAVDRDHLRVQLEDEVALLSRISEITLDYRFLPAGPVEESFLPHLHPDPGQLVGDASFGMPLGYMRGGSRALAIAPDVALLNRERRMPQAMELDLLPDPRLRHGLISHRPSRPDGEGGPVFYTREGAEPAVIQGESLHFAHDLYVFGNASRKTLGRVSDDLWASRENGIERAAPRTNLLDRVSETEFDRALTQAWAELELGGRIAGTITTGNAENLGLIGADAWFTTKQQNLRTAYGLDLFAQRTGQPQIHEKVVQMVDLLLGSPRRGGLYPAVVALDPDTGDTPWQPASAQRGSVAEHFRALDSAWTGYWLLRLAERIPQRRQDILSACGETARFLMTNQLASGAIPAYFDRGFLAPRSDSLYENGVESAGIAVFLAEYGTTTGDGEALAASVRALEFLQSDVMDLNRWADAETANIVAQLHTDGDTRTGQWPRGSLSLIYAAHAALILAAQDVPETSVLAEDLLDQLGLFQQIWSPNWVGEGLAGGLGATNLDDRWSTGRQSIAAHVWLMGYLVTGRRDHLRRGSLALRAGLAMSPGEAHWDLGAACTTAELARELLGQGVVDVAGNFAEGLDALWFEDLQIAGQEISFRLLSREVFTGGARITFQHMGDGGSFQVVANGESHGPFTTEELARGVSIAVRQVARIDFRPPSAIQHVSPWFPRASFEGPLSQTARVVVEIRTGNNLLSEVPMIRGETPGTLIASEPFTPEGLGLGEQIEVRLVVVEGGRRETLPTQGYLGILLEELHCLDPGDDDEANLVDAGASVTERFANGRENSRSVSAEGSFTYRIPVDPETTRLRLSVSLRGGVRITCGPNLLHEDVMDSQAPIRDLMLELGDRRLWQEGDIDLSFAGTGEELQVAKIRYIAEGERIALPTEVGQLHHQPLEQTLRVLVVPVELPDAPLDASHEALRQVFFGGPEYRLTPEPESRRTVGSASELVATMSGGLTSLEGEVADPVRLEEIAADLQRHPDGGRAAIARSLRGTLLDAVGRGHDVVAVVHGRGPQSMLMDGEALPGNAELPPVVFLTDRDRDGSYLSVGKALSAVLSARFGFENMGTKETGNFGELAITASGGSHSPTGPVGINLERSGWADRIVVDRRDHPLLRMPILQEDRAYYVLPGISLRGVEELLPGRGNLILEDRRGGPGEPGLSLQGGTLIYWHFPDHRPLLINSEGEASVPRFLRLSPNRSILETPFDPGSSDPVGGDLFNGPISLDAMSSPSLVSPQGELVWSIDNLRPAIDAAPLEAGRPISDGRRSLGLRHHPVSLLDMKGVGWSTGVTGQPSAPLPLNAPDTGLGVVTLDADGLTLTTRADPGGTLAALFPVFEEFDRSETEVARELLERLDPQQEKTDRLRAIRSLENMSEASIVPSLLRYRADQDEDVAAAVREAVATINQRSAERQGFEFLPNSRPHRLLASIAWVRGGAAVLRVGVGDREYLRTQLQPADSYHHLEVDLPAFPAGQVGLLWLQIVHRDGPPTSVRFDHILVAPRQRVWHRIQAAEDPTPAVRWMDGGYHSEVFALTLPDSGIAEDSTPVMLPEGELVLRLLAGLEYDAPAEQRLRVTVRLHSVDGVWARSVVEGLELRRGDDSQPSLTGLMSIPTDRPDGVVFLDLIVAGEAGATLRVQALEILRF